jgi:hypothetical protein
MSRNDPDTIFSTAQTTAVGLGISEKEARLALIAPECFNRVRDSSLMA